MDTRKLCYRKDDRAMGAIRIRRSYEPLRRYGHSKLSKMAAVVQNGGRRHLGFVRTENSANRSTVPEKPTLEPNMKWIGRPVAKIWPFEIFPPWRLPLSWICSNRKWRHSIRRPRKAVAIYDCNSERPSYWQYYFSQLCLDSVYTVLRYDTVTIQKKCLKWTQKVSDQLNLAQFFRLKSDKNVTQAKSAALKS